MKKTTCILILAVLLPVIMVLLCGSGTHFVQTDYVIKSGDTLWGLYKKNVQGVKWDKWLYEMEKANGERDIYSAGTEIILLTSEGSGA